MLAEKHQLPFVYRVHEKPNPDRVDSLAELVTALGFSAKPLEHRGDVKTADLAAVMRLSLIHIFIVEGDSALGACKQARDPDFQAIMPIRGKILNCLKADYDKIFKSDIITDLIKVLGCGVQVKSKANRDLSSFDMNLLRWNKVILCTDADYDGFQIRTLLLTMLYRLTPAPVSYTHLKSVPHTSTGSIPGCRYSSEGIGAVSAASGRRNDAVPSMTERNSSPLIFSCWNRNCATS